MVSVWPSVATLSSNYEEMLRDGVCFIATEARKRPFHIQFPDRGSPVAPPVSFYDSTNPDARAYLWQEAARETTTLSASTCSGSTRAKPEIEPGQTDQSAPPCPAQVPRSSTAIRLDHARGGGVRRPCAMRGEEEILTFWSFSLGGAANGYGAAPSGREDIAPTFEALAAQIPAGPEHCASSGIPWWTTDIGGFHGGDPEDPDYRELVIRWFQYGPVVPDLSACTDTVSPRTTELTAGSHRRPERSLVVRRRGRIASSRSSFQDAASGSPRTS